MNLDSPIEPEQKFYRKMIDGTWKNVIRIHKSLLKSKKINEKVFLFKDLKKEILKIAISIAY